MQMPSASNSIGTVLGGLAGAAVTASLPSMPFIIAGAAALGMTPLGLVGIIALGTTSLVNLAVSHIAEVKNLNDRVATWWPVIKTIASIKTYPEYPDDSKPYNPNGDQVTPTAFVTNLVTKDGDSVS